MPIDKVNSVNNDSQIQSTSERFGGARPIDSDKKSEQSRHAEEAIKEKQARQLRYAQQGQQTGQTERPGAKKPEIIRPMPSHSELKVEKETPATPKIIRYVEKVKSINIENQQKVEGLRKQVEANTYRVNPQKVAEAMVNEAGG